MRAIIIVIFRLIKYSYKRASSLLTPQLCLIEDSRFIVTLESRFPKERLSSHFSCIFPSRLGWVLSFHHPPLTTHPNYKYWYTYQFIKGVKIFIHRDNTKFYWKRNSLMSLRRDKAGNLGNNTEGQEIRTMVTLAGKPVAVALLSVAPNGGISLHTCLSWFIDGFVCLDEDQTLIILYQYCLFLPEVLCWSLYLDSEESHLWRGWDPWELKNKWCYWGTAHSFLPLTPSTMIAFSLFFSFTKG